MNKARGFTLIELLIVIAIIGILSAVVLASLNTARTKGIIAAGQSQDLSIYNALGDSLAGMWTFDECAGTTANDASGSGNTGTVVNGTWTSSSPFSSGCALTFNGSTSVVNTPLNVTSPSGTISFWFNPSSALTNGGLVNSGTLYIRLAGSGTDLEVGVHAVGGIDIPVKNTANTWYFLVVKWNGPIVTVYENNVAIGSGSTVATPSITGGLKIGMDDSGHFSGSMDDVRVYSNSF